MQISKRFLLVMTAAIGIALACSVVQAQPVQPDQPDATSGGEQVKPDQPDETSTAQEKPDAAPTQNGDAEDKGGEEGEEKPPPKPDFWKQMQFPILVIGGFILLYFWMGRSRRKQESKRKDMLAGLKKGDKVTSIGGVVGTVMEVREDEVTVKVDESNNIRMKFARWAIRGIGDEAKTQTPGDKK